MTKAKKLRKLREGTAQVKAKAAAAKSPAKKKNKPDTDGGTQAWERGESFACAENEGDPEIK